MEHTHMKGIVADLQPLGAMSLLMTGDRLLELIDASIAEQLFPGRTVDTLTAERVHFGSALGVVVEYGVSLADGGRSRMFAQLPWERPADAYAKARSRIGRALSERSAPVSQVPLAYLPSLGLVLRAEGVDERIGELSVLSLGGRPAASLLQHLPDGVAGGPVRFELLGHRLGKRAVLRAGGSARPAGLVLKLYKRNAPVAALATAHQEALSARIDGQTAPVRVPRVIASVPEVSGFLMEDAPGRALHTLKDDERLQGMGLAGVAIAALHACELDGLDAYRPSHEIDLLANWVSFVSGISSSDGARFARALQHVADRFRSRAPSVSTTIHRDFHERQIIRGDGSATLIDFDTLRVGDPAQDIGNFVAHLKFAGMVSGRDQQASADAFFDGYRQSVRVRRGLAPENVDCHVRATMLRLALINWFSEGRRHHVARLLEEVIA